MLAGGQIRRHGLIFQRLSIRYGYQLRSLAQRAQTFRKTVSGPKTKIPLFEELLPNLKANNTASESLNPNTRKEEKLLPLPTVEELLQENKPRSKSRKATEEASTNAFRHEKTAVLVLQAASKSLVEEDFRRLCPKGEHISEWTGPGEIQKLFPGRDPHTLAQSSHYFLIFQNPAFARAYQSNVMRHYRHARKYTPNSLTSSLAPEPGSTVLRPQLATSAPITTMPNPKEASHDLVDIEYGGVLPVDDAFTMLADFALCAPSQRLQLTYMYPPFSSGMQRLISEGGYLGSRAGRAVALWIEEGPQLTQSSLQDLLTQDEKDRGLVWDIDIEEIGSRRVQEDTDSIEDEGGDEDEDETSDTNSRYTTSSTITTAGENKRPIPRQRWLLTFIDQHDARRFIRSWHKRRVHTGWEDEGTSIVNTEFLW